MIHRYENVQAQANADVMLNRTEISFDYLRRSRHMPPPLNIIMYIFLFLVWFINGFTACIFNINIFRYIHYAMFSKLRSIRFWCCKKRDKDGNIKEDKKVNVEELEYFDSTHWGRRESFVWYIYQIAYCIMLGLDCIGIFSLVSIFIPIMQKHQESLNQKIKSNNILIHHKGCYGRLKIFSRNNAKSSVVDGITMSTYFGHYEEHHKRSITRQDRVTLNKLTAKTLFCPSCYQAFLNTNEEELEKELVTPIVPLVDFVSVITFVIIPIAWIPLIFITGIGAAYDYIIKWFNYKDRTNEGYTNQDYDRNYFPQFMPQYRE